MLFVTIFFPPFPNEHGWTQFHLGGGGGIEAIICQMIMLAVWRMVHPQLSSSFSNDHPHRNTRMKKDNVWFEWKKNEKFPTTTSWYIKKDWKNYELKINKHTHTHTLHQETEDNDEDEEEEETKKFENWISDHLAMFVCRRQFMV